MADRPRYLVDITSDAHERAINNNLSYIEGIVLNDIAYIEGNMGKYFIDQDHHHFLHMSKKDFDDAVDSLLKKKLIAQSGDVLFTYKMSLQEFFDEDPFYKAAYELIMAGINNK